MKHKDKTSLLWLINRMELTSNRYMEAENQLREILKMDWWELIFCKKKVLKFLESRKKYDF